MPNKDSFTFSDKLRKSKSVPLSKRLPSIVGGQNKQKRTLVQRAQRDLPFILVAACALLLLPFLSKNGSDDITGPANFDWDRESNEMPYADGGGNNIEPAGGMQDPLDLILTPRSAVDDAISPEQPRDAYGTRPHTDYNTRKGYDDEYSNRASTPSATSKFGKTVRPAVRKAVERTPTKTRELRISQMPSTRGTSSASHALPTGQAPKSEPSGSTINPGVRPVALQPIGARGSVGRSMTGENLYAEAARSIGAMNAGGPAKANLIDAQMKDQDGRMSEMALSPAGSFGGAGSPRPGSAGSAPGNTNGYTIGKPWWWDIMQARSQKWWELFEYKWREMMWTNIYDIVFNGGKQIANCLIFGNKEIDVSTMFGSDGGDPDYICADASGKQIPGTMKAKKHVKNFGTKTESGNKDNKKTDTNTNDAFAAWATLCKEQGGTPKTKASTSKGILQTRAECLGLDVLFDKIKGWNRKEYNQGCDGITVDGIQHYTVDVFKKGIFDSEAKRSDRLNNKVIIALVAKYTGNGKFDSRDYVVYAENAQALSQEGKDFAAQFKDQYGNCTLTEVISFVSKDAKFSLDDQVGDGKETENKRFNVNNKNTYWNNQVTGGVIKAREYCKGNTDSKGKALTLDDLKDELDPKKNSFNFCKLPSPKQIVKTMYIDDKQCVNYPSIYVDIDKYAKLEAEIENPAGKYVYAVLVEQLTSMAKSTVRDIRKFGLVSKIEANKDHKGYTYTEGKGFHFYYDVNIGVEGSALSYNTKARINKESSTTVRGNGKVLWIVTSDKELTKKAGDEIDISVNQVSPIDFTTDYANSGMCSYKWCKDVAGCEAEDKTLYCKYNKNKNYLTGETTSEFAEEYFAATRIPDTNLFIRIDTTPVSDNNKLVKINKYGNAIPDCTPMGLYAPDKQGLRMYRISSYDPTPKYTGSQSTDYEMFELFSKYPTLKEYRGKTGILPILSDIDTNLYCVYNNEAYKCEKIAELFIRTENTPSKVDNIDDYPECAPVAWYQDEQNGFTVYKLTSKNAFVPALPLTVKPAADISGIIDDNNKLFETEKVNYDKYNENNIFYKLKKQGKANPTMFELFPQIQDMQQVTQAIQEVVDKCADIQYEPNYGNNYIPPTDAEGLNAFVNQIKECLDSMSKAPTSKNLYFYGYASKKGDTCSTNPNKGDCNKALSEDRNLYLIQTIVKEISDREIGVENINKYAELKGFIDTKPKGILDANNRLIHELDSSTSGVFTLVSRPCGSEKAIYGENEMDLNASLKDRYVFVSLVDIGDTCNERINSQNVKNYLTPNKIVEPKGLQKAMKDAQFNQRWKHILENLQPIPITSDTRGEPDGDDEDTAEYGGRIKHQNIKDNTSNEEETTGYDYKQYL